MQMLFDLHTHTIASGHAFSTLKENIQEAKDKGLKAVGISDHSGGIPGAANELYFGNGKAVKDNIMGLDVFFGIEANIIDFDGNLDVKESILQKMDYVIASLHVPCINSGSSKQNTNAIIGAMQNPFVKIIGHPDDDRFPLIYDDLVKAASKYNVALEINSSSMSERTGRKNADKNIPILLDFCKKYNVPIIVGSDAHIYYDVGNMQVAKKLLNTCNFPEELVLNSKLENLKYVINNTQKLKNK